MNNATVGMPKQLDARVLLALAPCRDELWYYLKTCVLRLLCCGVWLALLSGCVAGDNPSSSSALSSSSTSITLPLPIEEPDNLGDLISSIRFVDSSLRSCVLATGALTVGELTELECLVAIRDSTGLEQLSALERLSLLSLRASDIDISGMPRLKALEVGEVDAIDLSHNTVLEYLDIRLSGSHLDLSHNSKLHTLKIMANWLEALDLSSAPELTDLLLSALDLRIVDLADAPNLINLKLYGQHLQGDALNALTQVKDLLLWVGDGSIIDLSAQQQLTHLFIAAAEVDTLDLSANTRLEVVEFNSVKISDELKLSGFSMLNSVKLTYSDIAQLDLSHNPRLQNVTIAYHQAFTPEDQHTPLSLSLNGSTELTNLSIRSSVIHQLDISENIALRDLSVSAFLLEEPLDLGSNINLQKLQILGYKPSHLDIRENTALTSLELNAGALITLDLTQNKLLDSIKINGINLTCDSINAIYQQFSHLPLDNINLYTVQTNCGIYADFPAYSFRKCILATGLSKDELPMLEQLDCDYVNDIQGISLFRDLKQLSLVSGSYKNIDLSHLHQLESLNLEDGELLTLTLPLSNDLHTVTLNGNDLSELDVSNLSGLNTLDLRGNRLQNIDLNSNYELRQLYLSDNDILEIDLSHNQKLQELNVVRNNLAELNLENQSELLVLEASYNHLDKLDLRNNSKLIKLHVDFNSLSELDLLQNTQLEDINIAANYFDNLDLKAAIGLKRLDFGGNNFLCSEYDQIVSGLPNLKYQEAPACVTHYPSLSAPLRISDIRFPNPEFSDCVAATGAIWANDVEGLACNFTFSRNVWGIEQLASLRRLDLGGASLPGFDLRRNTALTHLELFSRSIRKIDLTHNPLLLNLGLRSNYLSNLDLTHNSMLEVVDLSNNRLGLGLKGVSFGANPQIRELNLSSNRLTSVDLHALTKLQAVDLKHNKLQDVDFSHNVELVNAHLERNPLSDTAKEHLDTLYGVEVHYDGSTN